MLYLHIGTGKAGSTTIQSLLRSPGLLSADIGQIEAFGLGNAWKISAASGTENARRYWVEQRGRLSNQDYATFGEPFWDAVAREASRSDKRNFVASSEYIYGSYAGDADQMRTLRDRLTAIFGSVKIIVYCRDQVDFLKSLYAQRIKGTKRMTQSFDSFLAEMEDMEEIWNYKRTLDVWADVFGRDALCVGVFDRIFFYRNSLALDFLRKIDLADDAGQGLDEGARSNLSPTPFQLSLMRQINKLPRSNSMTRRLSRGLEKLVETSAVRTFPLNRELAIGDEFRSKLYASNAALNASFLTGKPDRLPES